jgi:hypothetical protein
MSHPPPNTSTPRADAWENEGGSTAPDGDADSLGVVRHLTETYSVGGFRYTNLTDAIAQARRMEKLDRASSCDVCSPT